MAAQRFVYGVPAHQVQEHIDAQALEGYEVQQLDYVNFMVSILFRPVFDVGVVAEKWDVQDELNLGPKRQPVTDAED